MLINHITLVVHLAIQLSLTLYFLTFMFGAYFGKEDMPCF